MKQQVGDVETKAVQTPDHVVRDHEDRDKGAIELRRSAVQPGRIEILPNQCWINHGLFQPGEMYEVITAKEIEKHGQVAKNSRQSNDENQNRNRVFLNQRGAGRLTRLLCVALVSSLV